MLSVKHEQGLTPVTRPPSLVLTADHCGRGCPSFRAQTSGLSTSEMGDCSRGSSTEHVPVRPFTRVKTGLIKILNKSFTGALVRSLNHLSRNDPGLLLLAVMYIHIVICLVDDYTHPAWSTCCCLKSSDPPKHGFKP